eukprot:m.341045 g.341045  ORF g.341045 m.341045 type:complete len:476 (-) comp19775_c0_seq1:251-1678(-)
MVSRQPSNGASLCELQQNKSGLASSRISSFLARQEEHARRKRSHLLGTSDIDRTAATVTAVRLSQRWHGTASDESWKGGIGANGRRNSAPGYSLSNNRGNGTGEAHKPRYTVGAYKKSAEGAAEHKVIPLPKTDGPPGLPRKQYSSGSGRNLGVGRRRAFSTPDMDGGGTLQRRTQQLQSTVDAMASRMSGGAHTTGVHTPTPPTGSSNRRVRDGAKEPTKDNTPKPYQGASLRSYRRPQRPVSADSFLRPKSARPNGRSTQHSRNDLTLATRSSVRPRPPSASRSSASTTLTQESSRGMHDRKDNAKEKLSAKNQTSTVIAKDIIRKDSPTENLKIDLNSSSSSRTEVQSEVTKKTVLESDSSTTSISDAIGDPFDEATMDTPKSGRRSSLSSLRQRRPQTAPASRRRVSFSEDLLDIGRTWSATEYNRESWPERPERWSEIYSEPSGSPDAESSSESESSDSENEEDSSCSEG